MNDRQELYLWATFLDQDYIFNEEIQGSEYKLMVKSIRIQVHNIQ